MARSRPLILLPPSEGKAPGGDGPHWVPGSMAVDLDRRRQRVAAALRSAMRGPVAARAKLLGVKGEALAAATAADRTVATAPTMPAIDRYTGVLYGALDAASLRGPAARRLDSSVLIMSGLWGLVAPADPLPDYKLKMGASLGPLGKLSTWWRPGLDEALGRRIVEGRHDVVWNLLPNEHDAAWSGTDEVPVVSVRFLEPGSGGAMVAVAHWNKFLKGAMVRLLVDEPDVGPDDLADWEHPEGFRLDPGRTTVERGRTVLSLVRS